MNALEKIEALEATLARAIEGRPAALDTITKRSATAEATLNAFTFAPSAGDVDKALAAISTVASAKALKESLGSEKEWTATLRHRWLGSHFEALVDSLEKVLESRAAPRAAYRQSKAEEIGRLSKEVVMLDGNGAGDSELEKLNDQLSTVEDDLANCEGLLHGAQAALRDLRRAPSPTWALWQNARHAVDRVSFAEAASV